MNIHSDIIIFEILNLYFETTGETEIDIHVLEKSFYVLISIINNKNSLRIKLSFKDELAKFLDSFSDHIEEKEEGLVLLSEIKELFNAVIDSHDAITTIDGECQGYVLDKRIYDALNITVPLDEMEEFFKLNCEIIKAYLKLGENEYHSYFDELATTHLKDLIDTLIGKLNEADSSTLMKLKICYAHLNNSLLPNTDEKHINSTWNSILFSYSPKRLYSISYGRLEFLVEMINQLDDDDIEEFLTNIYSEENNEENEKLDNMSYFLTIVLLELTIYLSNHPDSIAKEALLIKKYLLLNTPELSHIEKYYLRNHTLKDYPEPPIPEDLDENSFENLKNKVIECTTYLAIQNSELKKPHLLAKAITSAIFIKVFLDVSINPDSIRDIIDLITNSIFYKKTNFESVTAIVDEIIFGESKSLTI